MKRAIAKRAVAILCGILLAVLLVMTTFAATISWAMLHVEVWESSAEIRLCLCGHEWIHNVDAESCPDGN